VAGAPGFTEVGETVQLTPCAAGAEHPSVTGLLKPPTVPIAMLKVVEAPGNTVGVVDGDAVTEKSGRSKTAPTD